MNISAAARTVRHEAKVALEEFKYEPEQSFKAELNVVKNRHIAMQCVVDDSGAALQRIIQAHINGSSSISAAKTSSTYGAALMSAGPCQTFEKLVTLEELKSMVNEFDSCHDAEGLVAAKARCDGIGDVVTELTKSLNIACKDLYNARTQQRQVAMHMAVQEAKARMKQAKLAAASGDKAASGPTSKEQSGIDLVFNVDSSSQQMPTISWEDTNEDANWQRDLSIPLLITCCPIVEDSDPDAAAFLKSKKECQDKFTSSKIRTTHGRAQLKLKDGAAEFALQKQSIIMPPSIWCLDSALAAVDSGKDTMTRELVGTLQPALFGTAMNSRHVGFELHNLATMRLTLSGTRSACVPGFPEFCQGMKDPEDKSQQYVHQHSSVLFERLQRIGKTDLARLMESSNILWGTVGPRDIIYVPAGSVLIERTGTDSYVIGIKFTAIISNVFIRRRLHPCVLHLTTSEHQGDGAFSSVIC